MDEAYFDGLLKQFYQQAKAQFGNAIKSYWFNSGERCPGCGGEIDAMDYKGKEALSLNAFIYRERGILIGYLLCGNCAQKIMQGAKLNPYKETELHATIERNLVGNYKKYLRSLDA
jgi:hypothetical protein